MKIYCEHCHKEIQKRVSHQIESYRCGYVICPHCQKRNRRYLSGLDILLYFGFSSLLYSLGLIIVVLLMNTYGTTLFVICMTLAIVFVMYLIMKISCSMIYTHSFFKQEWRYLEIEENQDKIAKKGKREFFIYMAIAFLFATQRPLIGFYPLIVLIFILIITTQVLKLIKRERQLWLSKSKISTKS